MVRLPHSVICEKVFQMTEPQIRYFWGIYSTAAWVVPGVHWMFAGLCLGNHCLKQNLHKRKKSALIKPTFKILIKMGKHEPEKLKKASMLTVICQTPPVELVKPYLLKPKPSALAKTKKPRSPKAKFPSAGKIASLSSESSPREEILLPTPDETSPTQQTPRENPILSDFPQHHPKPQKRRSSSSHGVV